MQTRIVLGRSGLEVSPVCFGCWQMGQTFWGAQPAETLIDAVHAAVDAGVNFFDNADAYGNGQAEEILGRALRDVPREEVVVATKVFHHFHEDGRRFPDLSKAYILAECDASLRRLGLDHIDLYQAHAWDAFTPIEETIEAFEQLVQAGKVRAYGVSNFSTEQLRLALRAGRVSTIQPRYNLLTATAIEQDLLALCKADNVGVLVYDPLARGLLAGKFDGTETFDDLRERDPRFQGEQFRKNVERVEKLRPLAERLGVTVAQLVIAATYAHPAIHCAIVGTKSAEQIRDSARAMSLNVDRETYTEIRRALGSIPW